MGVQSDLSQIDLHSQRAASKSLEALRSNEIISRPKWLAPAFDDANQILAMVYKSAPYQLLNAAHGGGLGTAEQPPWFRAFWAQTGQPLVEGADAILHNPRFIEASKKSFQAEIVRPEAVLVNLQGPMEGSIPHVDLPTFRGIERQANLAAIRMVMGTSGLFSPWAVPVAAAICWFHRGLDGAFEYWPDGPQCELKTVPMPQWNTGLVADNDYMYHRVGNQGPAARCIPSNHLRAHALLHSEPNGSWRVDDGADTKVRYAADEIRISILWKGFVFKTAEIAARFDDHNDDLDGATVFNIFAADLSSKDIKFREPTDPLREKEWLKLLGKTYPMVILPGFESFRRYA